MASKQTHLRILLVGLLITFIFCILGAASIFELVYVSTDTECAQKMNSLCFMIGFFGILVSFVQLVMASITANNSVDVRVSKIAKVCIAFALLTLVVFSFYVAGVNAKWYNTNKPPMRGVFWAFAIWSLIHIVLFVWFVTIAARKLTSGESREQSLNDRERDLDEKTRESNRQQNIAEMMRNAQRRNEQRRQEQETKSYQTPPNLKESYFSPENNEN